jgi:hypothetical protein
MLAIARDTRLGSFGLSKPLISQPLHESLNAVLADMILERLSGHGRGERHW